ncbi:MAG TPA: arsenic resistance N-acetyltransferase ArsN2 [Steroidobacteraceae bacterium]|jgi:amino-acid N-acetyltransferase
MSAVRISRHPAREAAVALLEAAELPCADLTDAHMEHFFYSGPAPAPFGLVGLEFHGANALLRSLVVAPPQRSSGLGAALVAHAEAHARARGARSIFLLTTTAEAFFKRRGYVLAAREAAPEEIRATREFAEICPASSAFLCKTLS